ncbi:MAG TPA: MaoC family dehydratase N-terminal domain-containing protein [Roseiarcus sp.]|jgi:3-methylfumaryl-CoA hydratase
MTLIDIERLRTWIGRTAEADDVITPRLAASLLAVLDDDGEASEGAEAPTGIHWCLAPDIAGMSGLGPDGHPARGGFLPPAPLPRRMWAGGELTFSGTPLRVGDRVTRRSRIEDVAFKDGRSGPLLFVTVAHAYTTERGLALSERQDIVYREAVAQGASASGGEAPARPGPERSLSIEASATLLFRYSAATFNGHRIHYDRPYATEVENYPGLVVHGPLQATYLLRMARAMRGGALPASFSFRGVTPLFDQQVFKVCGAGAELWIENARGQVTMTARTT